ncbi:4-aminobutyrate aminotransferase family protein [Aequorivita sublithincola DSM 14238]|uniref:4-aminobutyrate aminotransferase family protein n=1 Tax=Aequorivita sublithincola (strain DSM 14238 / LMG 21431 / ACAM 643 / 9-3) TaxID=746697 RepID=I3YZB5_AEQSU|nr:aspartate aminotransferase family protein [Aequorivita sublithincola]AFL82333.1 4-aminobutyrate aminotransferase family protein [Aequorivita sublithincola DSM 14238]
MLKQLTKSEELLERRKNVVPNGVGLFNTTTVREAKGAIIIDEDGRELIDFAGGIGVVNAGHCPEPVVKAIQEQAAKYIHTSFNVVTYEPYLELCEKLVEILPHGERTKAMLVSTGAEAVENAIKIARQATKRQGVLCFTDAFHGRTLMAMTLTSKIDYKINSGPFAPEVYRLPFPNFYRYHGTLDMDAFVAKELEKLCESAKNLVDPNSLAAVILEPIQGEGGFNPVPQKYFEGLRKFCDTYGIMLIADEIQSGFGRVGNWSSWQNYNVTPDISTYAKSLGSGMPIAAILGRAEIMDAAGPSTIGGTYIGNPICCAAALATIQMMKDENLNQRGIEVGHIIEERFKKMQQNHPEIGDVRGMGAMMAMEFVKDKDPHQPDGELCGKIVKECAEEGLIIINAGTYKNIIRVLCPLVITDEQLHKGLDILENVINKSTQH